MISVRVRVPVDGRRKNGWNGAFSQIEETSL